MKEKQKSKRFKDLTGFEKEETSNVKETPTRVSIPVDDDDDDDDSDLPPILRKRVF